MTYWLCVQDDADEDEMMRRVDELTNMRLRENFPDAFKPKKKFHTQRVSAVDVLCVCYFVNYGFKQQQASSWQGVALSDLCRENECRCSTYSISIVPCLGTFGVWGHSRALSNGGHNTADDCVLKTGNKLVCSGS